MADDVLIPSINPAEAKDLAGLLNFLEKTIFLHLEKVTPAQIISYDRETNRASVQILNYSITSDGQKITRKPEYDIPVTVLGAGGFCFGFPVKQGDIGFLIAADSDISIFKKLLQLFAPAVYQRHKYKNSVFMPLIINGFTLTEDDAEAVLLTSLDGSTKISLKEGSAVITAENTIINSTLAQINTSSAEINADTAVITAESTINGNLTVNGDISNTGSITSSGAVTGASIIDNSGASGTFANQVTAENGIIKSGS